MDDFSPWEWDPPIWLAFFLLYVLPIILNLKNCIKNNRKLAPSLLVSFIYPTGTWLGIFLYLWGIIFSVSLLNKIELLNGGIAYALGFILANLVLFYPLFYIFDFSENIYENYKNKGIFSLKRNAS